MKMARARQRTKDPSSRDCLVRLHRGFLRDMRVKQAHVPIVSAPVEQRRESSATDTREIASAAPKRGEVRSYRTP